MGVRERRERERTDVRGRILSAARRLFAAEGYDAVSMRRIADAIEYSPTAIYFHFKDKAALIRELCSADFRHLAVACGELARLPDPVDRLRQLGRLYVRFAVDHPNHYKLMFMTPAPPDLSPTAEDWADKGNPDRDAYAFLLHTVTEGIAAGRFRPGWGDPQLVAQTVWAAVHGVAALHIAKANDPWISWAPLDRRIAAAVDGILDGLLVPTTRRSR